MVNSARFGTRVAFPRRHSSASARSHREALGLSERCASTMGEVAITLDAFDEEFEKALYPLSASDAVRPVAPSASSPPRRCCVQAVVADAHLVFENGPALTPPSPPSPPLASQLSAEAWAPQQKAGELLDWMYGRIPNHVGAAKLIEAGELLLAKGQHELARRECFAVVASAGLLASEDHRWERAARDEAHGPCVEKDRHRMHVQASFGVARCDLAILRARDPTFRHPQTIEGALDALARVRDATRVALAGDESLYWLVLNGTVLIHGACEPLMVAGHASDALASLAFATRCLDAHVLLAVPRRLAWRVTLVDAACRCDDHLDAGESAKTFLSRAVAQIDDLRALEALDPVPQKPETTAMYDDAERRLRALAAARDEDAASQLAKLDQPGHFASAPGHAATFLLQMLRDPKRRAVEHAPPESRAAAAIAKTKEWIAPKLDAMDAFYEHAEAARKAKEAKAAKAADAEKTEKTEMTEETEETEEAETRVAEEDARTLGEATASGADEDEKDTVARAEGDGEGDADGDDASPAADSPADLSASAVSAFRAAVAELSPTAHAGFLKRAFGYESWDLFERLAKTATLRRAHANAAGAAREEGTLELGVAADVLLAVNEAEGRGRREDEDGDDEEDDDGNDFDVDASPPAPKKADPRAALADALSSTPTSAALACADVVADAATLLWRLTKDSFTETSKTTVRGDADDAAFVARALAGIHRAFAATSHEDDVLRAIVATRLLLMLESRGETRDALRVAEDAVAAIAHARRAAVWKSRGSIGESTRHVTCEAVWSVASSGDGEGAASSSTFSFSPSRASETERQLACLHADALAARYRLALAVGNATLRERAERRVTRVRRSVARRAAETALYGATTAFDRRRDAERLARAQTTPPNPADVEASLAVLAGDNPWERAVLYTSMAALRPERKDRAALLERAATEILKGEEDERARLREAPRSVGKGERVETDSASTNAASTDSASTDFASTNAASTDAASTNFASFAPEKPSKPRTLAPGSPSILSVSSTEISIVPPDLTRLRSPVRGRPPPRAATFAVFCKPFGSGVAPGAHNAEFPNCGVKFPANGTVPFVTVGGLTPNVAYAFAVAAYDEDGELLGGGAGAPTRAVVAAPSIPTTMLWSNLAVAASRLGCVHVARRAAGTVCRRFVETKRADTPCAAHPTSTRKLRVAVVDAAVSPISRAACRAMFVAAEVALATRKKFGGRDDPVTAHSLAHSERAFDETFRLDVGKRLVLAAELACRADDATLAQEAALRFANCVAPVLASATRPRAMVAAIAQCLETLAESGKARTTTIARCAAGPKAQFGICPVSPST